MTDAPETLPARSITDRNVSTVPQLLSDVETAAICDRCVSGAQWEHGSLMLLNQPSHEERAKLSARHRAIVQNLRHFDEVAIGAAVAGAMGGYRNFFKPDENPQKVVVKYVKELQGIPTWACVRACDTIRLGHAPDISLLYPFSTMQLRVLAESYTERLRSEADQISRIMLGKPMAVPVSDEERARVKRKIDRLAHKMKTNLRRETELRIKPSNELARQASERLLQREYESVGLGRGKSDLAPSLALLGVLQRTGGKDGSDRDTITGNGEATQRMEGSKG